ncbi:flagellar assembly peptidoglycan hydrolase FlgJ [Marinobacter sp. SS21]|uniref:flagellar assembly peptidoglycan hydrolase FlgJ n=1 Tax=Marinobacter sp. SS21 TaxID=2979460 RepID=UPI00232D1602|nr:flagellar assembly peptidoglycan hydrolase FlgJ [Marinobacter sp. SS21]MDC0663286.1 flagellar assembly peptidoglycan hydrolase FlgJ [Marinobacter sp. SS21]
MQDPRLQQTQIYTEFSGLNALKAQARTDKQAALREVAGQFEGLFLTEMLKSMRKAGDVFAEGNYLNSQQSQFYRDMFDNQLSLTLSSNQGLGLTDTLVRQLSRQIPGMTDAGEPGASRHRTLADYDRSLPALSRGLPERLTEVSQIAGEASTPALANEGPADNAQTPRRFDSPGQFVRQLLPIARQVAAGSGIDPRLMVAQAALETGWGSHMIEGESGEPSYNLFGIKADQRWTGPAVDITTSEYREGVKLSEQAAFRAYPDYQASFRDYVSFLESNPRYREVLAAADNPELFAQRLQEAGYATDPNYANKIRRILSGDQFASPTGNVQLSLGAEE